MIRLVRLRKLYYGMYSKTSVRKVLMSVIVSHIFVLKKTEVDPLLNATKFIPTQNNPQIFGLVPEYHFQLRPLQPGALHRCHIYLQKEVFFFQPSFAMCTINYISLVSKLLVSFRMKKQWLCNFLSSLKWYIIQERQKNIFFYRILR